MTASTDRPNLFEYGRSELSQDAFLCWLLAWADPSRAAFDPALHAAGLDFVRALFAAAGQPPPPLGAIGVFQQLGDCDIVATIGPDHVLLIEDKVDAEDYNQLHVYQGRIQRRWPNRRAVCVFLKTGDQFGYERVTAAGWTVFGRSALLAVLRRHGGVTNDIFRDYLRRLEDIEAETAAFRTAPPHAWLRPDGRRWRGWSGLFLALEGRLPTHRWGYVANPAGGFMCFNYASRELPDGTALFPQIEQDRLALKLHVPVPAERRAARDRWVRHALAQPHEPRWVRPARLGVGAYMSIAQLAGGYRRTGPEQRLDLDATVDLLQRVGDWVAGLVPPEGRRPTDDRAMPPVPAAPAGAVASGGEDA